MQNPTALIADRLALFVEEIERFILTEVINGCFYPITKPQISKSMYSFAKLF